MAKLQKRKLNAKFTLGISLFFLRFYCSSKGYNNQYFRKIIKGGFKMLYLRICEVAKKQGYSIRKIERIVMGQFASGKITIMPRLESCNK